ncbi:MAG: 3-phosphoshikimate 1-carboxyvinyltransferase [Ilumatobacteraceae bacterium]
MSGSAAEAHSIQTIQPGFSARVEVPGSKSIANRALVCAGLARGGSRLHRLPDGDDTVAMLDGLAVLGVSTTVEGETVNVAGVDGRPRSGRIDAGLAGTTSRFLTAVAALAEGATEVTGARPLRGRPFGELHRALRQIGAKVDSDTGGLPAIVTGPVRGGRVRLEAGVSSQFVSALMMAGACMPDGLEIELHGVQVSRPYIDMTSTVMALFGAEVVDEGGALSVAAGGYRGAELEIEPDASSASYPAAVAAACGGEVVIPGLGVSSVQGDVAFREILRAMGASVITESSSTTVSCAAGALRGVDVDMRDCSDLVPTIAVLAALADGVTRIDGVGFIRRKESDRLGDLADGLARCGVAVEVTADGLVITGGGTRGARVAAHHDHRLAMAFGVLGSAVPGVVVEDPDVVSKSWPGYWGMLDAFSR